jgi:hypothetical protein
MHLAAPVTFASALRERTLATMEGIRARLEGLPRHRGLGAANVFEADLSGDVVDEMAALYERHVAPNLEREDEAFRSEPLSFYVTRAQGWRSDVKWWSPNDVATFDRFRDAFERLALGRRFRAIVDVERGIRLYCPFFVTRSWCEKADYHYDYEPECRTNAYTLMTPLCDYAPGSGQLAYLDAWGRRRVYTYRRGRAVIFGARFWHSTQPIARGEPRAFLCFTFGTDKSRHWPGIEKTVGYQSNLLCRPDGTFRSGHSSRPTAASKGETR